MEEREDPGPPAALPGGKERFNPNNAPRSTPPRGVASRSSAGRNAALVIGGLLALLALIVLIAWLLD